MNEPTLSVKEIMEKALETPGGLIIRAQSRFALQNIRWRIYTIRRNTRRLLKKMHGTEVVECEYDTLCASIRRDGAQYALRVYKEEDLFILAKAELTLGEGIEFT